MPPGTPASRMGGRQMIRRWRLSRSLRTAGDQIIVESHRGPLHTPHCARSSSADPGFAPRRNRALESLVPSIHRGNAKLVTVNDRSDGRRRGANDRQS